MNLIWASISKSISKYKPPIFSSNAPFLSISIWKKKTFLKNSDSAQYSFAENIVVSLFKELFLLSIWKMFVLTWSIHIFIYSSKLPYHFRSIPPFCFDLKRILQISKWIIPFIFMQSIVNHWTRIVSIEHFYSCLFILKPTCVK